jgi:hypothetical protein
MTLPSSGAISMSTYSVEMGQASTFANSMSWINARAKVTNNAMGGHYNKAWYQRNQDGNCNNGNCTSNCNCGNIQCTNCVIAGGVNCANCDGQAWLQANCNCACAYNCTTGLVSYNCNCACACACDCMCG